MPAAKTRSKPYVLQVEKRLRKAQSELGDVIPISNEESVMPRSLQPALYLVKVFGLPTVVLAVAILLSVALHKQDREDRLEDRKAFIGAMKEGHEKVEKAIEHNTTVLERVLERISDLPRGSR